MSRPLDPDHMCPAYWPDGGPPCREPSVTCDHEHCENPTTEPHAHHDIVDHTGPWVRWCDHPLTCDRLDCDLSAASASRTAATRAASLSGHHAAGEHDDQGEPGGPTCDDLMES